MNPFAYKNDRLYAESVPLVEIVQRVGTPCYVYSKSALESAYRAYDTALEKRDHLICYAAKANSSLAILNLFAKLGSGFDIVSGGELARVQAAGGEVGKVVFSGVGKNADEIRLALEAGILCFNIESESELNRISEIAGKMGKTAPISVRVNPDVDAKTHPYIATGLKQNKFGVAYDQALSLYLKASRLPQLKIVGIGCHIGSQLTEITPIVAALEKILLLVDQLSAHDIPIFHIDVGGGLGIRYRDEVPPEPREYVGALLELMGERPYQLLLEPGRSLVGNAGILLTRVEYIKHNDGKNFLIVDAAMNDLMRPALYDAFHDIVPLNRAAAPGVPYDVVGPVCESGDFLGLERSFDIAEGDLLAIMSTGAYGMSMSSNYNTRPRSAEIWVDGDKFYTIRERETIVQLMSLEKLPPA